MTETPVPASDVHPDVLELAQKITDKVNDLLDGVDGQNFDSVRTAADQLDALNEQLQNLLVEPKKSTKK